MSQTCCERTDLLVEQCSHCRGLDERPRVPRWSGSEREAMYPGSCACCGQHFPAGTLIALGDVDGDGGDAWCIAEHTAVLS